MQGQHRDLAHEFPEHKDRIHQLKGSNAHFRKLNQEFEEVEKAIVRSEARIDLLSEGEEEKLRRQRLNLKDQLYSMLAGVGS